MASHLVLESNNGQWPNEASMGEYMNILPIALKGGFKADKHGLIHLDFIHLDLSR